MTVSVYTGWISATESDRAELEELGVVVGPWNADARCFDDCQLDGNTLRVLTTSYGHKYYTGMRWAEYSSIWGQRLRRVP